MGNCDLCNADIGPHFRRVSPSQFREAVRNGLRPRGMAAKLSNSLGLNSSAWVSMAMQSLTDWALCPECSEAFDACSCHGTSVYSGATRVVVPRVVRSRKIRKIAATGRGPSAARSLSQPCPIKVVHAWKIPFCLLFTLGFYNLFWLYRVFRELHTRKATDLSPDKAVGYLFIPFFNLGWIFVAWKKLGDAIGTAYSQAGLAPPSTGITWLAPISFFLAIALNLAAPPAGIFVGIVFLSIALCALQGQMNRLAAQAAPPLSIGTGPVLLEARFCSNCGTATTPGGKFCVKCGSSLSAEKLDAPTNVKQPDRESETTAADHPVAPAAPAAGVPAPKNTAVNLAVMAWKERSGARSFTGEDASGRRVDLSAVSRPALLFVPRETLPHLKRDRALWSRVKNPETAFDEASSPTPEKAAEAGLGSVLANPSGWSSYGQLTIRGLGAGRVSDSCCWHLCRRHLESQRLRSI
jgi:hypothetical protein